MFAGQNNNQQQNRNRVQALIERMQKYLFRVAVKEGRQGGVNS